MTSQSIKTFSIDSSRRATNPVKTSKLHCKRFLSIILNTPVIYFKGKNLCYPDRIRSKKKRVKFNKKLKVTLQTKPASTGKMDKFRESIQTSFDKRSYKHTDQAHTPKPKQHTRRTPSHDPNAIRIRTLLKQDHLRKDVFFMSKFYKSRKRHWASRRTPKVDSSAADVDSRTMNFVQYYMHKKRLNDKNQFRLTNADSTRRARRSFHKQTRLGRIPGYHFDSVKLRFDPVGRKSVDGADGTCSLSTLIMRKKPRKPKHRVKKRKHESLLTEHQLEARIRGYVAKRMAKNVRLSTADLAPHGLKASRLEGFASVATSVSKGHRRRLKTHMFTKKVGWRDCRSASKSATGSAGTRIT